MVQVLADAKVNIVALLVGSSTEPQVVVDDIRKAKKALDKAGGHVVQGRDTGAV